MEIRLARSQEKGLSHLRRWGVSERVFKNKKVAFVSLTGAYLRFSNSTKDATVENLTFFINALLSEAK